MVHDRHRYLWVEMEFLNHGQFEWSVAKNSERTGKFGTHFCHAGDFSNVHFNCFVRVIFESVALSKFVQGVC